MTDHTLSERTALALSRALEKATAEIDRGKVGLNESGQRTLEARARNIPKLELLGTIGDWLIEHGLAKSGFFTNKHAILLTLTTDTAGRYHKDQYVFFDGTSWYITEPEYRHIYTFDELLRYNKYHSLPDVATAQDLLDQISFETIVKAWLVFARERGLPLPDSVNHVADGKFSLYLNRDRSNPSSDMR